MGHTKPSGRRSQRIISQIHNSWKTKSANHASQKYPSQPCPQTVQTYFFLLSFLYWRDYSPTIYVISVLHLQAEKYMYSCFAKFNYFSTFAGKTVLLSGYIRFCKAETLLISSDFSSTLQFNLVLPMSTCMLNYK